MAEVERKLMFEKIPKEKLVQTLSGEGQSNFPLGEGGGFYPASEGWYAVSHTFALQEDESALFTILFERAPEG